MNFNSPLTSCSTRCLRLSFDFAGLYPAGRMILLLRQKRQETAI